jgi:hypothetical protein
VRRGGFQGGSQQRPEVSRGPDDEQGGARPEGRAPCRLDTKRKILLALGLKVSDKDRVFGALGELADGEGAVGLGEPERRL